MSTTPNPSSESTLTARYQTTVPAMVRETLGLSKGDKIRYSFSDDQKIYLSRVDEDEEDPVIGNFLDFLAKDMTENPQYIQAISADLVANIQSLVEDVEIDLDAPLLDEDE